MRYDRTLCPTFASLLSPKEPLGTCLRDHISAEFRQTGLALDLQLRETQKVMLYLGCTRPLVLQYDPRCDLIHPSADLFYTSQSAWEFEKAYAAEHIASLVTALEHYMATVAVNSSHYSKEGGLQNRLSTRFGVGRQSESEWVALDREVVLGYRDKAEKAVEWEPIRQTALKIGKNIPASSADDYGTVFDRFPAGNELDLLLWDPSQCRFLVAELKDGSDAGGVYKSPLQVAAYTAAWRHFAKEQPAALAAALSQLLDQKRQLGLISGDFGLPDPSVHPIFEPILIIQDPKKRSRCWRKMGTVRDAVNEEWPRATAPDGVLSPPILGGLRVYAAPSQAQVITLEDITAGYATWPGATRPQRRRVRRALSA